MFFLGNVIWSLARDVLTGVRIRLVITGVNKIFDKLNDRR